MKLGVKMDYTLTALADLYANYDGAPVNLTNLAKRQRIPLPYLSKNFHYLQRAKIVKSTPGVKGGYSPALAAEDLTLYTIAKALGEKMQAKNCHRRRSCNTVEKPGCSTPCLSHFMWDGLQQHLMSYMRTTSLAALIAAIPEPLKEKTFKSS